MVGKFTFVAIEPKKEEVSLEMEHHLADILSD
jgi:hypothetical protein